MNRGRGSSAPPEFQQVMPLTKVAKWLIIANVSLWIVATVILEQYVGFFQRTQFFTHFLGLTPKLIIESFFVWQPFTYMFFHDHSILHVLFNCLLLWWLGSELERHWGSRFFFLYYMVSGVGAAFLYVFLVVIYAILTSSREVLSITVVGASGAIFGLLVAYGLVFGERIVYFMFFFPMKAKWFVAILGGIEVLMVLNEGVSGGKVANLAHVSGLVSGFVFLWIWARTRGGPGGGTKGKKKGPPNRGKLKLVVNNEEFNSGEKPRYWN